MVGQSAAGEGGESLESLFLSASPTRRGPVRDSVPMELADMRERGTYIFRVGTDGATDPGIVGLMVGQTMRRLHNFVTNQPAVAGYFGFRTQVTDRHMLAEVPAPPELTVRHQAVPKEIGLARCTFEEVAEGNGEDGDLSPREFVSKFAQGVAPLQRPHDYGHVVGLSQTAEEPFEVIVKKSGRVRTEAGARIVGDMIEAVTARIAEYAPEVPDDTFMRPQPFGQGYDGYGSVFRWPRAEVLARRHQTAQQQTIQALTAFCVDQQQNRSD
jgi:hypothetical protein